MPPIAEDNFDPRKNEVTDRHQKKRRVQDGALLSSSPNPGGNNQVEQADIGNSPDQRTAKTHVNTLVTVPVAHTSL